MRKLIVSEFISLDGIMEALDGEASWLMDYIGEEHMEFKLQEVLDADVHLLGRVTYEIMAADWPKRAGPFGDRMNSITKYVVTNTLDRLEWDNSIPLQGDAAEEVAKLKQGAGGPILVAGSRTLVHTLIDNDLVDEYCLMIFPVILGAGKPLFPHSPEKRSLDLAEAKTFTTGVQVNTYRAQ